MRYARVAGLDMQDAARLWNALEYRDCLPAFEDLLNWFYNEGIGARLDDSIC